MTIPQLYTNIVLKNDLLEEESHLFGMTPRTQTGTGLVEATGKYFTVRETLELPSVECYVDLVNNELPGMVGVKCLLGGIQASVFNQGEDDIIYVGQNFTILLKICNKNEPKNDSAGFKKLN